jgi:hypothetical protein
MVSFDSLKGYFLEEILAYLIRNTGYRLLVDPVQDERELAKRGNGLVVQGRGGVHQVDVLGQLIWIPAFTFPIRLFVEAKCRGEKTGLPVIRNAVGVVDDINQNYSPIREGSKRLIKHYSYRYALFSTSGFTAPAVDYALAHQISLIDLGGPDFEDLQRLLESLANIIFEQEAEVIKSRAFVKILRLYIRTSLGTWPGNVSFPDDLIDDLNIDRSYLSDFLDSFTAILGTGVNRLGEFFVGMADGPFLLIFKPRNELEFLSYAERFPAHRVTIRWTFRENRERQWVVEPVEEPGAYTLSFGLPQALADWVFGDTSKSVRRALSAKELFLSDVTIYRHIEGRDFLYRLTYDAEATQRSIGQSRRSYRDKRS